LSRYVLRLCRRFQKIWGYKMLSIELIRKEPEKVKKGIALKGADVFLVDKVLELDEKRRGLILEIEELRSQRNKFAKEKNVIEGKRIKDELKVKEPLLAEVSLEYEEVLMKIPNLPLENVPEGEGENDNVEIRRWPSSHKNTAGKGMADHLDIMNRLDLIDFESGAKVAGSQFYYLKNDAVRLEYALMQFGMEILEKHGYKFFMTPDLAKSRYYLGTGYQPKGDEAQIYEIKDHDLGLIATAEVTMAGYHADEILKRDDLPLKYAAISHCFRQEAGAYGKYSRGLYRVHQFTKLECFIYCLPEKSIEMHEEILGIEEEILRELEIPYRVVEMCTGDLGAIAAKKYDLEAWMPGRGDYGEVTSTSNTTDYQSRNLNIKYRAGNSNEYVHMLNGTAIAVSRTLIAIMENYQQKDGSIIVPKVLRKWLEKEKIG